MKINFRKSIVAVLLLAALAACNRNEKVEIKNKDGVVIESFFVDKDNPSQKIGVYTKYYDSGKILETGTYKNGKLNGERKLYYENGHLMQSENYIDNKFEGAFNSFYEDGSKQQEGSYKDNMMSGLWKNYFQEPKDIVKNEITMQEGKINGPSKEYFTNGKVYAEGNKTEIGDGIDVYDGKVQVYDSLGTLQKTITYEKGRQVGKEEK
jgi:antitoxin component YwqK of YwqJK toxin-antitoxin module